MKIISLIITISTALFVSGCGGMFKGKAAAELSIKEFHRLYNDGKLAEMYAAANAKFKGASTEKEFLDIMGALQRKLGKVIQSSNAGYKVQTFNFTTTVVMNQNTTFEQGSGTEVFTFQMDGDKAVLAGYNINSKDLILK